MLLPVPLLIAIGVVDGSFLRRNGCIDGMVRFSPRLAVVPPDGCVVRRRDERDVGRVRHPLHGDLPRSPSLLLPRRVVEGFREHDVAFEDCCDDDGVLVCLSWRLRKLSSPSVPLSAVLQLILMNIVSNCCDCTRGVGADC